MATATQPKPEIKTVENATCTFCGCVCDDMILTVEGNRITKAKNACVLGNAWFLNHDVPIPLRPAFESPYPSDFDVLSRIEQEIRHCQARSQLAPEAGAYHGSTAQQA